jgi:hypothetical protein
MLKVKFSNQMILGIAILITILIACGSGFAAPAGNPFASGWYADPDMRVYNNVYWVYPTYSAPYDQQTFMDAFSSSDLINWTKYSKVLDKANVSWATRAIWAPSPIYRNGTYYLYFAANDIQNNTQLGGIGVATATNPAGPFVDALGHPLIGQFYNGAQPIDQNAFIDEDGQAYLYYGGWSHCNVVKLNSDMKSLGTFPDGTTYKEITPSGYVEGPLMFKRNGKYYLMWSEGGWTGPDYCVAYATSTSPTGPFTRIGKILTQNSAIGTGSGHNTVVCVPGTDTWYIFYHRHPLGDSDGNHRVLCNDRMYFNADGTIQPVVMTCEDNLSDGNNYGWTNYGGTWTVTSGQYSVGANPGAKSLLNTNFSALIYDADLSADVSGDAGLIFRVTSPATGADSYKGYYAGINAGTDKVVLGKANNNWTQLATSTQTINANTMYHLKVVASGSNIKVYFNNSSTACIDMNDSTYTSGATGVRTYQSNAKFDNINITLPAGAIFYQDGNFGGTGVMLGKGNYTMAQLNAAGIPNDWMSSLKVPSGWTVDVYQNDNFTGTMWKFTVDTPSVPSDCNDQMTSVKIY